MKWITVRRLGLADIPSAFPLVHLHRKELTLDQWSDYARGVLTKDNGADTQGLIAAFDGQGTIHGILQYEKSAEVDGHSRVIATNIIACGLFLRHRIRVTTALKQALSKLALESGCERVTFEVPASERRSVFTN